MKELLQQLWDEYKLCIDTLNDNLEESPEKLKETVDLVISDTPECRELREMLRKAGITL